MTKYFIFVMITTSSLQVVLHAQRLWARGGVSLLRSLLLRSRLLQLRSLTDLTLTRPSPALQQVTSLRMTREPNATGRLRLSRPNTSPPIQSLMCIVEFAGRASPRERASLTVQSAEPRHAPLKVKSMTARAGISSPLVIVPLAISCCSGVLTSQQEASKAIKTPTTRSITQELRLLRCLGTKEPTG